MKLTTKQRLIGALVILAIVAIVLPLFVHGTHPKLEKMKIEMKLPPAPKKPAIELSQKQPALLGQTHSKATLSADLPVVSNIKTLKQAPLSEKKTALVQPTSQSAHPPSQAPSIVQKADLNTTAIKQSKTALPSKPVKSTGNWTVQVGTFSSSANAKHFAERLKSLNYDAYLQTKKVHKKTYTKVLVGNGLTKEQAQAIEDKLKAQMHIDGLLRELHPSDQVHEL